MGPVAVGHDLVAFKILSIIDNVKEGSHREQKSATSRGRCWSISREATLKDCVDLIGAGIGLEYNVEGPLVG